MTNNGLESTNRYFKVHVTDHNVLKCLTVTDRLIPYLNDHSQKRSDDYYPKRDRVIWNTKPNISDKDYTFAYDVAMYANKTILVGNHFAVASTISKYKVLRTDFDLYLQLRNNPSNFKSFDHYKQFMTLLHVMKFENDEWNCT